MKKIIILAITLHNALLTSDKPIQKYRISHNIDRALKAKGYGFPDEINKLSGKVVTRGEVVAAAERQAEDYNYRSGHNTLGTDYADKLAQTVMHLSAKL